jgi:hypothetical protein
MSTAKIRKSMGNSINFSKYTNLGGNTTDEKGMTRTISQGKLFKTFTNSM